MKIWSVFSLVIVFHGVVIGLLLIQPGCQSQSTGRPDLAQTTPQSNVGYQQPSQPEQLDSAFNSGLGTTATRPGLTSPSRPTGSTRTTADTGMLTPVLNPVQDGLSVPTIQSEYTVKGGDNLTSIARREGVTLNELLKANGLNRSSTIFVGQKLVIPAGNAPVETNISAGASRAGKQVVVASGDTLGKIASRAGTSVKILKELNGLSGDTIFIGQKLLLPEGSSVPVNLPSTSVTPTTTTVASGQGTYVVKSGDTPSGIARKFGVTTSALMAANGMSDPRKMNVGKSLVIPQGGTAPAPQPVATTNQPVQSRSGSVTTRMEPVISEPTPDDPMSILEALEDEDIPFAEVEVIDGGNKPGN
jgi:LysM repeat protein